MRRLLWSMFSVALLVGTAAAAQVDGVIIDKACSSKIGTDQKGALAHTAACARMESCERSGYGVLTADGKYLTFDAAGNTKAIAALKQTAKKDNLKVRVNGDVKGDMITVSSISIM